MSHSSGMANGSRARPIITERGSPPDGVAWSCGSAGSARGARPGTPARLGRGDRLGTRSRAGAPGGCAGERPGDRAGVGPASAIARNGSLHRGQTTSRPTASGPTPPPPDTPDNEPRPPYRLPLGA